MRVKRVHRIERIWTMWFTGVNQLSMDWTTACAASWVHHGKVFGPGHGQEPVVQCITLTSKEWMRVDVAFLHLFLMLPQCGKQQSSMKKLGVWKITWATFVTASVLLLHRDESKCSRIYWITWSHASKAIFYWMPYVQWKDTQILPLTFVSLKTK